ARTGSRVPAAVRAVMHIAQRPSLLLFAMACAVAACVPREDGGSAMPGPRHPLLSTMAGEAKGPAGAAAPTPPRPQGRPDTLERMARYPEPGWHIPRAIAHSPDGKLVTFLQSEGDSDVMSLFAFDRATQKVQLLLRASDVMKETKPLSREEELRRERQRQRIV